MKRNYDCPICHKPRVTSARCFYAQSWCDDGHTWYYCPVDGNRVIGTPPSQYKHECHCSLSTNNDNAHSEIKN